MKRKNTTENTVITSAIFYDTRLFTKFLIKNGIVQPSNSDDNIISAEKAFLCKRVFFTYIRRFEEGLIPLEEVERILNILDKYVKNEVDVIWNTDKNTIQVKRY